jgi:hypothetical protein
MARLLRKKLINKIDKKKQEEFLNNKKMTYSSKLNSNSKNNTINNSNQNENSINSDTELNNSKLKPYLNSFSK